MSVLDDEMLLVASVPIFEDLFKSACTAQIWDESVEAYLVASAGTLPSCFANEA